MYCDIKLMLTCWVLYHILHFFIHGPSDVFLINNQSGFIACDPDEVFAITDSRGGDLYVQLGYYHLSIPSLNYGIIIQTRLGE